MKLNKFLSISVVLFSSLVVSCSTFNRQPRDVAGNADVGSSSETPLIQPQKFDQLVNSIQQASGARDSSGWGIYLMAIRYDLRNSLFGFGSANGVAKAYSFNDNAFFNVRAQDSRGLDGASKEITLRNITGAQILEINFGVSEYESQGKQRAAWGETFNLVKNETQKSVSLNFSPAFSEQSAARQRLKFTIINEQELKIGYLPATNDFIQNVTYIYRMKFNQTLDSDLTLCQSEDFQNCKVVAIYSGGKLIQPGDKK